MSVGTTGSGVERAMFCAASCALPGAGHTGEAAIKGSENHKGIEEGDQSRPVVRDLLDGATDVRHEVAYALDLETHTVREIGVGIARDYGPLSPTELALTVDLECKRDGVWWQVDFKSRGRVSAARDNWQCRVGTMAVLLRHGADQGMGAIAYLDDSELDATPVDAFHVAAWWADLRSLASRIRAARDLVAQGGMPSVSAGPWCKYCPALPHCPAHTRLALSLVGELESVDAKLATLTPDQAGNAWEKVKRYKLVLERIEETLREYARREPLPLPNGRRLALVESRRTSLDTKKAAEMLGASAPFKTTHFTQVREVAAKGDDR